MAVRGPHMLPPEDFPITIEVRRQADHEVVWTKTIEKPASGELDRFYVPPLAAEHGPCETRTTTASGGDSGWMPSPG